MLPMYGILRADPKIPFIFSKKRQKNCLGSFQPFDPLLRIFRDLFPEGPQLLFVRTELFRTILAVKIAIRRL